MHLTLHLTRACNLRCDYCYAPPQDGSPMSFAAGRQALELGSRPNSGSCGIIVFGGGDVPARLAEASYQFSSFSGLRTSFQSGMLCTLSVISGRRLARRRGRRSFRWAEVRGLSPVSGSSPFAGSKGRRSSMVEQPPQGVLIPRQSLAHRFACSERGWVERSDPGRRSVRNKPCRELVARIT